MKGRGRRRRNESVARPRSGSDGGDGPISGYEVGSRAARVQFGTREGSRGGDYSQADLVTLVAASEGRAFTAREEHYVRGHIANAGFDPLGTERVGGRLAGLEVNGRVLTTGEEISTEEVHYSRHVVHKEQWPSGASQAQYVQAAREIVLDPASRILYSHRPYPGGERRHLGFVRESGSMKGPGGDEWVFVEYRLETGHLMTAFQTAQSPEDIASQHRRERSAWMNASS